MTPSTPADIVAAIEDAGHGRLAATLGYDADVSPELFADVLARAHPDTLDALTAALHTERRHRRRKNWRLPRRVVVTDPQEEQP